jgi:hypothetical protein
MKSWAALAAEARSPALSELRSQKIVPVEIMLLDEVVGRLGGRGTFAGIVRAEEAEDANQAREISLEHHIVRRRNPAIRSIACSMVARLPA